jgi:biopolymer transport protein ExbB
MPDIIQIIIDGGIVMFFILPLSLVSAVIIIERLLYFRKIKIDEDKMINRLKSTMEKQHYDEALSICETNPSPVTNLIKIGIEHRKYDSHTIRDTILDAANLEIPKLERNLSTLGTIASIAPLLGLLGTVLGNIDAFGVFSGMQSIGDPTELSKGIAEALYTTAAGLIVSIPAIIFYNYLVAKVNHIIIRLENKVNDMVLLLGGAA